MGNLREFFLDLGRNAYGLGENVASLGSAAIAEPVAGYAAMFDPANGAQAIREGMTYTPRTEAGRMYQQGAAKTLGAMVQPAMPVIDTWQRGVDIAGRYSPVAGAALQTVPTAIGALMGYKPAMQTGRQVSNSLGAMQQRMIANANAPRTLNTGFMGQRGAINPSDFNLVTNPDGTVTLYHGTTRDAAQKIIQDRKLLSAGEPDVYMTTDPMAGYGDGTTIKFNIDPKHIFLDDEFPSGRVDFRMPAAKGWRIQNPEINTTKRPLTEFEQAHLTAQSDDVILDTLNPTGSVFVDYNPKKRATAKLASNIVTYDKTAGGRPDDLIEIYRGLPKNQKKINSGDFVTTNKQLAKDYAGDGHVISMIVKKSDLLDDLNEPLSEEYIYRKSISNAQRPLTEFEQAHLIAQQNAALPVSQGGLGLAPDNTAMDRARAMGFDVDNPVYHGTGADFDAFDPNLLKETSQYMKGIFTTDNPNIAGNYGDIIYPLVQKQGYTLKDKRLDKSKGITPKQIDTIRDKEKNIFVTNNPQNIRSRFAAFDPMKRDSANLLADAVKLAPATTLGAYMYNEKQKQKKQGQ